MSDVMVGFRSEFLREACERGFIYQGASLEAFDDRLCAGRSVAYLGIDATAESLHVGHLLPLMLMRLFAKYGHTPMILLGGATAQIGDPTFKTEARKVLSPEEVASNVACILKNIRRFWDLSDDCFVNNADWFQEIRYMDVLRDVCMHMSVNRMLTFESVKARLEAHNPLSLLEFNYMVMQAYDFLHLFQRYGCIAQFGGQDQWGNMLCGVDLIQKREKADVFCLTTPLLLQKNGEKMGKTVGGAIWLDADKLAPYHFWQFFRNVDDEMVGTLLGLFTDLDMQEVRRLSALKGAEINQAKIVLADEVTKIVHGEDKLASIHSSSAAAFGGGSSEMACDNVFECHASFLCVHSVAHVLKEVCSLSSIAEAKRLLRSGAVRVDDVRIDESYMFQIVDGSMLKVACGKKNVVFIKVMR